jgi:hypothetical protein
MTFAGDAASYFSGDDFCGFTFVSFESRKPPSPLPMLEGEPLEHPLQGIVIEFDGQPHPNPQDDGDENVHNAADQPTPMDDPHTDVEDPHTGSQIASLYHPTSVFVFTESPAPDGVMRHGNESQYDNAVVCGGGNATNNLMGNHWITHWRQDSAGNECFGDRKMAAVELEEVSGHQTTFDKVEDATASNTADHPMAASDRAASLPAPDHQPSGVPSLAAEPAPGVVVGIICPHDNDVKCGRGKPAEVHEGNQWYLNEVAMRKATYVAARSRLEKRLVAEEIVALVNDRDPPGRFLKQDSGTKLWNEIGNDEAIAKAEQALREKPTAQGREGDAVVERPPRQPTQDALDPVSRQISLRMRSQN